MPSRLELDERVKPPLQTSPGAKPFEKRLLGSENCLIGRFGHREQQIVLVVEVVIQLASRRTGPCSDLVQAGSERPSFGHDIGCRSYDPPPSPTAPLSCRLLSHAPILLDLTVQFRTA